MNWTGSGQKVSFNNLHLKRVIHRAAEPCNQGGNRRGSPKRSEQIPEGGIRPRGRSGSPSDNQRTSVENPAQPPVDRSLNDEQNASVPPALTAGGPPTLPPLVRPWPTSFVLSGV
ncbi:hypothetical protein DPEC_G00146240 [Dallia pectoralis]|uniref:Uncharacterized protein n=1 Tax=Dallia pectoralis TaxID=75939 RepID=A0ACC2GPA8_DALPE|nr:hypothetical protein DPEC_G00146240 [Dallia pectoralis]